MWNEEYFKRWSKGESVGKPRQQVVYALNLRADKILPTSVERVHYDKHVGTAEITAESMRSFARRRRPGAYQEMSDYLDDDPASVFIDFEDILRAVEKNQAYQALMDCAKLAGIASVEQKGFISCLLVLHAMRSHEFMTAILSLSGVTNSIDKWEHLWLLKNAWSDPVTLSRAVTPLAMGQWILYRTGEHHFPLPDSPVMINPDSVMTVLSPRLLLEINLNVVRTEDHWIVREGISPSKYREFRRRAIRNSFKQIIFKDRNTLDSWRSIPEYKHRVNQVNNPDELRLMLGEAAARVVWMLGGMGRVPPDFEAYVRPHFEK